MPWKEFERLNAERSYNEEPLFANPRSAASGTLKIRPAGSSPAAPRRPALISAERPASLRQPLRQHAVGRCMGIQCIEGDDLLHSLEEVDEFIRYWDEHRRELPWLPTDWCSR